ncbi:MAG: Fe-S cluster assembly protein NifU [Candidatus Gastranaerophilaceae bacterium]|jgi:NifU-like protein
MWEYTQKVQEYYKNPKNVGEIKDADVIGEAGSIVCGDALKLYLKVDENGIITEAKFQTFGCGSAVASSSALTEMIIGKNIEEAAKLKNEDIVEFLGGLPNEKLHCSVMGQEALEDAIAKYNGTPVVKNSHDRVVCQCFGTTEKKLRQVVREHHITDVCGATNYCKAGGGCGKCKADVQSVVDDENRIIKEESTEKKLTKTQMIIKVNNIIENYISDQLRKDGGDIELIDVDENKVFVKLKGTCQHCPSSSVTIKHFVEKNLKEQINANIEVIEVD